MDVDLDQLRELMQALNDFELDELEIEQGKEKIVLRRKNGAAVMAAPMMQSVAPPAPAPGPSAPAPAPAADDDATYITSPFVGTFYTAPSPDADAFVTVGGAFTAGQPVCIVEAMKLMNEIEAEFGGTILEVLIENGKPVEYGDRLFRVEKK